MGEWWLSREKTHPYEALHEAVTKKIHLKATILDHLVTGFTSLSHNPLLKGERASVSVSGWQRNTSSSLTRITQKIHHKATILDRLITGYTSLSY